MGLDQRDQLLLGVGKRLEHPSGRCRLKVQGWPRPRVAGVLRMPIVPDPVVELLALFVVLLVLLLELVLQGVWKRRVVVVVVVHAVHVAHGTVGAGAQLHLEGEPCRLRGGGVVLEVERREQLAGVVVEPRVSVVVLLLALAVLERRAEPDGPALKQLIGAGWLCVGGAQLALQLAAEGGAGGRAQEGVVQRRGGVDELPALRQEGAAAGDVGDVALRGDDEAVLELEGAVGEGGGQGVGDGGEEGAALQAVDEGGEGGEVEVGVGGGEVQLVEGGVPVCQRASERSDASAQTRVRTKVEELNR